MTSQKTKRDIRLLKTKISKAQTSHNATNKFQDFTLGQIALCLNKLEQFHERWISYDYMSGAIVHYDMYLDTLNTLLVDARAHLFEQRRLELEPRTPSPPVNNDPNLSDDDHVSIISGGRPSEHDDEHEADADANYNTEEQETHLGDPRDDDPVTTDDDLNITVVDNDPNTLDPGTRTPTPDPPRNITPTGPRPSTPRLQTPPPAPPFNPVTGGFRFTVPLVRPAATHFRPVTPTPRVPTPTVPQPMGAFRPITPSPTTYNTYNPYCPPPGYPQHYQQPQPQPVYYQVPQPMPTTSAAEDLLHKMVANAETQQKQMSQLVQCFEKIASQGSRSGSHRSTPLSHRSTPPLHQHSSGPPPVKPKPKPKSSSSSSTTHQKPPSTKPTQKTSASDPKVTKPKDAYGSLLTMLSDDDSDSTDPELEDVYKRADEMMAKIAPKTKPAHAKDDSDSVVEKLLKHMATDREATEQARQQEWRMTLQAIRKDNKKSDPMKIQDIPLPTFSGDADEYEYFKTAFNSLIGSRSDKTPKEKALRLASCLKQTAAAVAQPIVKGGTFEDSTYELMWAILDSYFGDEDRVQNNKLKKFMTHPAMPHWSHSTILELAIVINEFVLYAKRLQPSWIEGNTPAYTSTRDKLPRVQVANYTRWVLSLRQKESLELLYEWLMMELKAEQAGDDSQKTFKKEKSSKGEKVESSPATASKPSKLKPSSTIKQCQSDTSASDSEDFAKEIENTIKSALAAKKVAFKDVHIEKPTSSAALATMRPALKTPNTCIYCKKESHIIYECPTWIDLRNTKKYTWLGITSGCYHCLLPGHYARDCTFKKDIACGQNNCKRYHHVSLHPTKQDVVNAMWEEDFLPDDQIDYLTSESI